MHLLELLLISVLASVVILATGERAGAEGPAIGKPPPKGVVELVGIGGSVDAGSLVELGDGSLLMYDGRRSTDGGETWTEPQSFGAGISGSGILRLQSGAIALSNGSGIWLSGDEGKTWRQGAEVFPQTIGGPHYLGDEMIQLSSGRLLYPCYAGCAGRHHPELLFEDVCGYGTWRGQRIAIEGHGHLPEIGVSYVSYSDDEGQTWTASTRNNYGRPNALMGWFDAQGLPTGYGGVTPCVEPTVAETNDGRVLLFARSTVGRIVYSYTSDGGETWSAVLPTELAASNSPPRLRRIPQTGDLLCVWNQVSREEIRRGYRRGRLSAAISQDSGRTWGHFQTIELSQGLEERDRIPPEYPIQMVRARDDVGQLPDGYAYFHYPTVCLTADKVFIMYLRATPAAGIAEGVSFRQEQVMRIYPLEWFYQ